MTYAVDSAYMRPSDLRLLPCHTVSRDVNHTEDSSHQSPTNEMTASLISGGVC